MPITDLLERNSKLYGEEIALVEINPEIREEQRVTWKEYELIQPTSTAFYRRQITWSVFDEKANRVANMLIERGIRKGQKCAILLMNCLEWLPIYFGIMKTGAIAVPMNFRFDADEIRYCLDASDSVLLRRYKSTRRMHPLLFLNKANTLEEAIAVERQMLARTDMSSFVTVDTSFLTTKEVKRVLEQYFAKNAVPSFSISFLSFGYKYGVPLDADLMIDVRFLPNPFWVPDLRVYSGDDPQVYNYVMDKEETKEFCRRLLSFLDYAFTEYAKEGKNHFTVAIGCTGGQHRSVTITNYLYDHYKDQYRCYKQHRDEKEWLGHE